MFFQEFFMSVFGIISEFNPLHLGHAHLIRQARARGAQTVVCIMSGNTVQRGELAVMDQYTRAEAAIRAGADLVLSLPFPWCSASAEAFATCGIEIARHFCDTLIFGSECGDIHQLQKAAEIAATLEFRTQFRLRLDHGEQAASAYHALLREYGIPSLSSNDTLGVAYLRAAIGLETDLNFQTILRQGAEYTEQTIEPKQMPSALAIRKLWEEGKFEESLAFVPKECAELYRRAYADDHLTDPAALDLIWLSFFRLHSPDHLSHFAGAEGGLAQRICSAANHATTTEELIQKIQTKRYTDAHLRRTMLFCLAHVCANDLQEKPQYTTLLAANERGRALLKQKRKEGNFLVITKPADAPKDTPQFRASQRIDSIFTLATKKRTHADSILTSSPYIE